MHGGNPNYLLSGVTLQVRILSPQNWLFWGPKNTVYKKIGSFSPLHGRGQWFLGYLDLLKRWWENIREILQFTLPETNIAPENRPSQKETRKYSNHPLLGALAVSFREGNGILHGRKFKNKNHPQLLQAYNPRKTNILHVKINRWKRRVRLLETTIFRCFGC